MPQRIVLEHVRKRKEILKLVQDDIGVRLQSFARNDMEVVLDSARTIKEILKRVQDDESGLE